ncbi:MAG: LysM peptidoglycan-binding domain-containing protein, partial [Oscillospiraceae bacterium]|nr:LysM peptidoglycan-binding domain-containing protein [Oscillospiraceae bacterium]
VYFDLPESGEGNGRIAAELHLAAQCICRRSREINYMADIYSNRTQLLSQTEPLDLIAGVQPISMRQTVTGSAEPAGEAGDVLALFASVGSISAEESTIKTAVSIRVICCQQDGQISLSRCRLAAEFTTDLPEGTELAGVTVTTSDVYYTPSGTGIDLRATLQMEALAVSGQTVSCIAQVTEDAEAWAAVPPAASVVLVRVEPGADLWALARKYHSTVEAIEKANEGREKGLLLIPKCR